MSLTETIEYKMLTIIHLVIPMASRFVSILIVNSEGKSARLMVDLKGSACGQEGTLEFIAGFIQPLSGGCRRTILLSRETSKESQVRHYFKTLTLRFTNVCLMGEGTEHKQRRADFCGCGRE